MPVWQWLLDAAGVLLGLVLLYGVGLDRPPAPARPATAAPSSSATASGRHRPGAVGFSASVATPGESLEWFRYFSLWPRPSGSCSAPR